MTKDVSPENTPKVEEASEAEAPPFSDSHEEKGGGGLESTAAEANSDATRSGSLPTGEYKPEIMRLQLLSPVKLVILSILAALLLASALLNVSLATSSQSAYLDLGQPHWLLIAGLVLITAFALLVSFWMYYTRSVYLKDGPALVPEKWGNIIGQLAIRTEQNHAHAQQSFAEIQRRAEIQAEKSEAVLESFLTLQESLSSKDKEIERLKAGYDAKIFKAFLQRFIRVDRALRDLEEDFSSEKEVKKYSFLSRLMEDALEECGVEQHRPEIGSDFREAGPVVADEPTIIITTNSDDDFKIAQVESPGYIIEGQGEIEVILPSKVAIYRTKQEGSEDK